MYPIFESLGFSFFECLRHHSFYRNPNDFSIPFLPFQNCELFYYMLGGADTKLLAITKAYKAYLL